MNNKTIHGKIFKSIREKRGIKLKDAAGSAISARTLIRFEADETSVSLEIFEQLLRNIGIRYQDYFSEYLPLVEVDDSGFLKEANALEEDSHIPSFEEFVTRAKELKMPLLVELKPHGAEPENYVDLFVQKMKELGVEKDYPTMSLDLSVMEKVEKKAPEIKTGYVIPIQFGQFKNTSVDFFAIEDFSYQEDLVTQAHEMKKELYVWTINDEQKLTAYLQRPIDGIITDELTEAQSLKKNLKKNKTYFDRFLSLVSLSTSEE